MASSAYPASRRISAPCSPSVGAGVRTDAGVILGPAGPIAFCLLTKDNRDRKAPGGPANELIAKFARATLDAFEKTGPEGRPMEPRTPGLPNRRRAQPAPRQVARPEVRVATGRVRACRSASPPANAAARQDAPA